MSGEPGKTVTVQRSSNLVNWVVLTNMLNTNGILELTDPTVGTAVQQFYRGSSP